MDLIDIEKTNIGHLPDEEEKDEEERALKVEEIKRAVALLPNGYRTVLTLYLFEGYDQEEIAGSYRSRMRRSERNICGPNKNYYN